MTINEFNGLNPKEKEIAVINGEWQTGRWDTGKSIVLYSVSNFFVELWYDGNHNEITMLLAFTDVERLTPYLHNIKLDMLLE